MTDIGRRRKPEAADGSRRLITKITVFEDPFTIDFRSGFTFDIEA